MVSTEKYIKQAKHTAEAVYEDWKKISARATKEQIEVRTLRVSDHDKMLSIIALHVLLARANQADACGNFDIGDDLRNAANEMEE